MPEEYTLERIREFWHQQALAFGEEPEASWSDRPVIEMEIRNIVEHLENGHRVLDIGCGNGFSTVRFASARDVRVRGLDNIPEMVERARHRLAAFDEELTGRVGFDVGDITTLNEPDGHYDRVVVIRVLINLRSWDRQTRALHNCARVLRPGGLLLLSEATVQGWRNLNAFRGEWGMDPIPVPPFNEYVDEDRLAAAVCELFEIVEIRDFASTYYVGTRVLKPLLDEALGGRAKVADPNMHWNRFFSSLPAAGDYGTQKLFVLRKR